jgi:hypothetical protein
MSEIEWLLFWPCWFLTRMWITRKWPLGRTITVGFIISISIYVALLIFAFC